jgi:cold shock CspA family protein
MPTGNVKVFGPNGYGFIAPDLGGAHVTAGSRRGKVGRVPLWLGGEW